MIRYRRGGVVDAPLQRGGPPSRQRPRVDRGESGALGVDVTAGVGTAELASPNPG